jgi:hypothetical protein
VDVLPDDHRAADIDLNEEDTMALNDLLLSLMAFPQQWDGPSGILTLNILLLPVGDPTAPLGGGPKFAGTNVKLKINVASGLDSLPSTTTVPAVSTAFSANPPAVAPNLFSQLLTQLTGKHITVTSGKATKAPPATARILKTLPESYTTAFPFNGPSSRDLSVGDGYGCALRGQAPPQSQLQPKVTLPPPDTSISWGQVISYALRQPVLAADMGLIYTVQLNVPPADLANGGFLWVSLDASSPSNPWVGLPAGEVKSYAARIPAVDATHIRPLFAAALLPIVATPPSNLAQAQQDAEEYDDGFAQIVHSNQPDTIDAASLDPDQIAPGTDAGLQIGWDDEKITIWLNAQLDLLRDRVNGTTNTAESPLGVQGYRVDVRQKGAASWSSLNIVNGSLPFDQNSYGGTASTNISGNEFWVAPAPIRPSAADNSTNDQPALLPLYFAQWAGASLVLPDPAVQLLAFAANAANQSPPVPITPLPLPNPSPDLTLVPTLRYGNDYQFRVRLVDLTGGGPLAGDASVHPGPAPVAQAGFRRYVPPKQLLVTPSGTAPVASLDVRRPRIGYPEAVFAGVDPSTFSQSNLANLLQDALDNGGTINVPDPDVDRFEVYVEARVPAHDTGTAGLDAGDLDGVFRVIYSVEVPFPSGADPTVTLTLDYTDGIDDISTLSAPAPGTTTLTIPTSRDVRVRLFPKAAVKPNYYGNDAALTGLSSDYVVRQEAATEDALFPNNPELQLQAFYFQPGANIAQIMAQQLGLKQNGFAFSGAVGERTVFGCSGHIRHIIAADDSSVTFSNQTELLGQWIVALTLDLERDWTWDGFGAPALSFQRGAENLGVIAFPRVVGAGATGLPGQAPDRSLTRIVFFDAVNPQVTPPAFPRELNLGYTVSANFTAAAPQQFAYPIRLPITTTPAQTPKIVSTGIAESRYIHSDTYSETTLRDRYLWVEFDRPIQDGDDNFFGRVLAYGPDPLLAGTLFPKASPDQMLPESVEPALPIDPEPVRVIFSGQSADESGLDAMTQMVPADKVGIGKSGTFYLLPLPPGLSSEDLDLFGFWTYEFRVGHVKYWSTAQGRFGRPLRVTGLQHPSPHLICSVNRQAPAISASAPYAVTVFNGNRLFDFRLGDPQTRIWFMLYAQVLQADAASYRNVLLDHKPGIRIIPNPQLGNPKRFNPQQGNGLGPVAGVQFPQAQIEARLDLLGLPKTTALSVLAVEILPGPLNGPDFNAGPAPQPIGNPEDPLGANLGQRRILRTSPLTAVPAIC